ncbi:MAG: hypothetical protein PHD88_02005 [Firmicutes bacterium]|nr:hypothetical protein [Bacillota bacterium]MDD4262962.1 hypothetical protein [Bacillota bacterium]MDD4693165.1 hypothetical protein [Bacillota bacterium]
MQVVITTNSPGEVSAWVIPVAAILSKLGCNVDVILTPCTFATGKEADVLKKQGTIRRIYPPEKYWRIALGLEKIPRDGVGCVLFLGGDIWHAKRLGRLLNYPVAIYSTKRADKALDLVFVPNQNIKKEVAKRVSPEKIEVVGDLMFSSLKREGLVQKSNQIALFPGSREYVKSYLPFFLGTAELIKKRVNEVGFVISFSEFVTEKILREALKAPNPSLGGVRGKVVENNLIQTQNGLTIPFYYGKPHEIMETSALALTVPGTNTAEMAFYGLPLIAVLPFNIAREIPLEGLVGIFSNIPMIGPIFKERLVWKKAPSFGFIALPNIILGKEIVPEIKGFLDTEKLADFALDVFTDKQKLSQISEDLLAHFPKTETAKEIAESLYRRWGEKSEKP